MALLAHNSVMCGGKLHPRTLLHNGYQQLLEGNEVKGGASTACVGTVGPDGVLMVAKYVPPPNNHLFLNCVPDCGKY